MVVRVGLYKQDASKPFFADLADIPGGLARVRIVARGVATTLPAIERPPGRGATALVHLRYNLEDLAACGLDANARNQFLTGDPEDPLKASVTPDSALWGSLDGSRPEHGSASAVREADGTLTLTWELPYVLLRHLRDPYQRTTPGGFFEPPHFHVELEVVPIDVAEATPESPPSDGPKDAARPK
ncbi:hypothetical protein J4558_19240 [Leptolyngbya sp. 15MV]|nr:hypothetical protein J4558_19240 [Leptolyngbya sp. 15MV]